MATKNRIRMRPPCSGPKDSRLTTRESSSKRCCHLAPAGAAAVCGVMSPRRVCPQRVTIVHLCPARRRTFGGDGHAVPCKQRRTTAGAGSTISTHPWVVSVAPETGVPGFWQDQSANPRRHVPAV